MSLALAAGRTVSTAASTTSPKSIGATSSRILPLIILETSRRSSTSCASARVLRLIDCSPFDVRPSSDAVCSSIAAHPRMAFSGVRSSWDAVARNSSFARLASSACARAACSLASKRARSSSARTRSLMSRAIFDAPITTPSRLRTGETVSEIGTCSPVFGHTLGLEVLDLFTLAQSPNDLDLLVPAFGWNDEWQWTDRWLRPPHTRTCARRPHSTR